MSGQTPEVHAERCVRFRYRYSACARCAEACPHDAVGLSEEGVAVDAARCRDCALCASTCPTGALDAANVPRVPLLKQALGRSRFAFACAPSGERGDAVVPCLGALDAPSLAYLARRGVEVELQGAGHCDACDHGATGAQSLAANVAAVERLRSAAVDETWAAIRVPVRKREPLRRPEFAPARRQLLRRFVGRGIDAVTGAAGPAARPPSADAAIRAARAFLPEPRELLQLVGRNEGHRTRCIGRHPAVPAAQLEIGPGCTACEACFRVCPTGALQIRESDAVWSLAFVADRCVGCEVCAEVCQPQVLATGAQVDFAPGRAEIVLHRSGKRRCARCDRSFKAAGAADLCPICLDDADAFAAIFG